MNDLSVHFEGVSKRYPHFALENIHLQLPTGSIMGLIGTNGAGKSTTIHILMGLVHQDEGAVHVFGHAMPAKQAEAKLDIGFVSEDMRLYGAATLAWHMAFIRSPDNISVELLQKGGRLEPAEPWKSMQNTGVW